LETSLWDVAPIYVGPRENVTGEWVVGGRAGNTSAEWSANYKFLAAGYDGMYYTDHRGRVLWHKPSERKYTKTGAADLDGDGELELLGLSGDTLYAWDQYGTQIWSYEYKNIASFNPIRFGVSDQDSLVVVAGNTMTFLDGSGKKVWEIGLPDKALTVKAVGHAQNMKILVGTQDGLYAYRVDDTYLRSEEAAKAHRRALEAYGRGDYNLTLKLAGEVLRLYEEMGLDSGEKVSEAYALKTNSEKIIRADDKYAKAEDSYRSRRYNVSLELVLQAHELYATVNYTEGIKKCTQLEMLLDSKLEGDSKTTPGKMRGDEFYNQAEEAYINNDYNRSIKFAEMALLEYQGIRYTPGVKLAENLIFMNKDALAATTTTTFKVVDSKATQAYRPEYTTEDLVTYGALAAALLVVAAVAVSKFRVR